MHLYPDNLTDKIGFDTVRKVTMNRTRSVMGSERISNLSPSSDDQLVKTRLNRTREMTDLLLNDAAFPLEELHDIRDYLASARAEESMLPLEAFIEILQLTITARRVKSFLEDREERYPTLHEIAVGLIPLKDFESAIKEKITDHGSLRDDATPRLKSIRKNLNNKRNDLRTTVNRVMRRASKQGFTSDEGPTLRNGRMVIPVLAEHKKKIQGFVHDVSSTGQTVYLEPVEALNINNEIRQLESEEKAEIERIIKELTSRVRENREYLTQNVEVLGLLDAVTAIAQVSIDFDAFVPVTVDEPVLRLKDAYNPILLLKNRNVKEEEQDTVVPLNLDLEKDECCLVITGPNAGGKSVALKTVGLCALMMQSGYAIPAKDTSQLPIFDGVFVDIGDDQSIESDLSTFSSRLEWMKKTIELSGEHSLVLIDEAAAGTDPEEGGALFQALIEMLIDRGAKAIVTTHHGSLKLFANDHPRAVNGSMEFDQETLSPTYRFKKGVPGSSYAFEIAERMELQEQLLEKARAVLGEAKGNLEELINELESKAQEAEKIKQKYDQLKQKTKAERSRYEEKRSAIEKERDQIREKALKEAEEIVKTANQRIEEAVERIVEKGKKDKEEISKARRDVKELKTDVKEEIEDLEQQKKERLRESTDPPEVGDQVRLQDAKTTGELVEVSDGRAVVETGGFRLKTDYGNLVKVEDMSGGKKKKEDRVQVNISRSDFSKQMSPSLNLRGMRGGEAVQELTRYLDKAIAAGRNQVEIIHGKGEGILKKLVHEYLDKRKEVTDYELAPPDRGGAGCTIVYL